MPNNAIAQTKFGKTKSELAKLKKLGAAVEADPENLKTHETFIVRVYNNDFQFIKQHDSLLIKQYALWMKKFPKSAAVPFALGRTFAYRESPQAREYLLKAVSLNPNLTEAWKFLSEDASIRSDLTAASDYMKKAVDLEPENPDYASSYAFTFQYTDSIKFYTLCNDLVKRFPGSKAAALTLFSIAFYSNNPNEKTNYYEELYKNYLNLKFYGLDAMMTGYFDFLIGYDIVKALSVAQTMSVNKHSAEQAQWKSRVEFANNLLQVKKLLLTNKPKEAEAIISNINLKNLRNVKETVFLLKAEIADADNRTKVAYDSIAIYYSKSPSDTLRSVLLSYASKLGISNQQVDKDIWQLRVAGAKPATIFSLKNYLTSKNTSLSDYKGKVVLITYWFPGCGPCRSEFPSFEKVIKKFKDVAYIGINIENEQDDLVLPFLKTYNYSFTPLRDDPKRNKGNLPAFGAPTNYLIDQHGRIIFSDFRIDSKNERTLELMISELLNAETH